MKNTKKSFPTIIKINYLKKKGDCEANQEDTRLRIVFTQLC